MPSEPVTLIVSTGVGISVIAGILSGVCYVLVHGFKKRRNRKSFLRWHCAVCGLSLRSIEGVLDVDKVVTCSKCQSKVCKTRCSSRNPIKSQWTCQNCSKKPISWIKEMLGSLQTNYKVLNRLDNSKMSSDRIEEIDEDLEAIRKNEKEQVRDFIERLVASMLGGNVDDVSVTKLYNDKNYDALFTRYHQDLSNALTDLGSALHISIANLPVTGQSPCTAHAALKQIIQRLLRESLDLPNLKKNVEHPAVPNDESNRTYEDLLATAILNKVISNCQNNLPSSSAASVSSQISTSSRNYKTDKEYFFGEETLENKWKNPDLETTSVSSLEEWIQSDSSLNSNTTKYVDRVSLTIQQRIEEVSPSDSENEIEDFEYFRNSHSLINDDDSNWYLQKRKFHGTHSPVPVPMLVPNPTTEAKVLIGEKEVDETSDLSDAESTYGDMESAPSLKSLLVESKMVIGGKNFIDSADFSDAESSADSGVREDRGDLDEEKEYIDKPKTDKTIDDENVEDASLYSNYSHVEKDTEYTEKYASLSRTVIKSPSETSEFLNVETQIIPQTDENVQSSDKEIKNDNENNELFQGTYSKKEKEKWQHPIEMKNNPYSKENIERRMKNNNNLFGRDYYTRQASLPSGTRKRDEVSLDKSIKELEETYTYSSLPRSLYSPKNSSRNFVKNPLLNLPKN